MLQTWQPMGARGLRTAPANRRAGGSAARAALRFISRGDVSSEQVLAARVFFSRRDSKTANLRDSDETPQGQRTPDSPMH